MNLGVTEIALILVIALLLFGPSRLPNLGKSIGEAIRGFKKGISENPDEKPAQVVRDHDEQIQQGSAQNSQTQNQKNKQNQT